MESSESSDSSTDSSISSDDSTSNSSSDSSDSDDSSSISGMSIVDTSCLDNEVEDHGTRDVYDNVICQFSYIMGLSIIELDDLLVKIIDLTAIRRHEWLQVRLTTSSPKKNRTIDSLGPLCYHLTRFQKAELHQLIRLLFGKFVSETFKFKGNVFTYEETLLIALDYMSNATKYITMSITYGGDWSKYSLMVNWFSKFMYHTFYHRLCGRSLDFWLGGLNTSKFRHAIFNYVKYDNRDFSIPEMADLDLDTF